MSNLNVACVPVMGLKKSPYPAKSFKLSRKRRYSREAPNQPRYILEDDAAGLYQLVAGDWNDQALATLTDFGEAPTEAALITAARLLAHAETACFVQASRDLE